MSMIIGGQLDVVLADGLATAINGVIILALTIWSFLRDPYIKIRKYGMSPMSVKNPQVVIRFITLAKKIGLKKIPILLRIPDSGNSIALTFGTFTHRYVAISDRQLESMLKNNTFDAIILHELGHIASGDIWKVGLSIQFTKWLLVFETASFIRAVVDSPNLDLFFITEQFITLGGMLVAVFIFIATRILIQIREFAADEYVISHLGSETELIRSLTSLMEEMHFPNVDIPNSIIGSRKRGLLSRLFSFHPDTRDRKSVSRKKEELDILISRMAFIFGIVVGQIASYYSNVKSGPILIGWMMLLGPFFLTPAISSLYNNNKVSRLWMTVSSVLFFCAGSALLLVIRSLPSTFYEISHATNKPVFMHVQNGLTHDMSFFFDIFFIVIIIMPFILFIIVSIFSYLYQKILPHRHFMTPWLMQIPLNLGIFLLWTNWMNGAELNLMHVGILFVVEIIWLFIVIKGNFKNHAQTFPSL
ncbi:MAG: M48 family metalloprotease [Anaerolineales bacterium]|nr:M48 family metalloprotease [Anaerolineales bacterium]